MSTEKHSIEALTLPLFRARGWLRLISLIFILIGVLMALTVVGLLVAWLPIWLGVVLLRAANAAAASFYTGDGDKLLQSLHHLRRYFTLLGVILLIWSVLLLWIALFHTSVHWFFMWPHPRAITL